MAPGLFLAFFGPLALGWGLGLFLAYILARKPRLPVDGRLATLQLLAAGLSFFVGAPILLGFSDWKPDVFFPASFIAGTVATLGPALYVRWHDRRHGLEGQEAQVERPQEVEIEPSQETQVEDSIIEAFRQLSQRIDGQLDEEELCVTAESEVGRAIVEVESYENGGFRSYFSMEFARPLPFELDITNRGVHSLLELQTDPGIGVGDERFDHDFVVRGEPADSVRSALDADARAAIEALSKLTRGIGVDRECASAVVVGLVLDAEQAAGIVRALEAVTRALASDRGAYR